MDDINKKLLGFLKNAVESIEKNEMSEENVRLAGEYYMKTKFVEYIENNDTYDKDMMKYLILGWYMYSIMDEPKNK
jgi:hypothetical protein